MLLAGWIPRPEAVEDFPAHPAPLIASVHHGFWEIGAAEVARRCGEMRALVRPPRTALDARAQRVRERYGIRAATLPEILAAGLPAGFMLDRDPEGEPVRVAGRQMRFSRVPFVVARRTGRPVVPAIVMGRRVWFGPAAQDPAAAAAWFDRRLRGAVDEWWPVMMDGAARVA
jgi:lauroyl/myristoyl acyltransferase